MAIEIQHQHVPQPPDTYNVFERIPQTLINQIRTNTCTTDLKPFIQDAIDSISSFRDIWFPSGFYPLNSALRISTQQVRLRGPGFADASPAVFKAMGDSLGGTDHTGMLVVDSTFGSEVRGIQFDRAGFLGDAIIWRGANSSGIFDCSFYNLGGVKYKTANSASAATDIITGPSGTSTFVNVGDRLEFWVGTVSGDALPGGLSTRNGYFVVFKSGNTFKVSATVGGAAVNLTTNGSGTWGFHKYSVTWESSSIVNNTIGVTGHPFVVGHKVVFSNPAALGNNVTMPSFISRGQSYYVVEVPDANSFKVSTTQGGTPVTVTTTGSLSLKPQISLEYNPIRGANILYGRIDNCRISNSNSGIKLLRGELDVGGASWYGMNVGTITRITGAAGHTFDGIMKVASSSFEGNVVSPNEAVVRTAGQGVHLDHVYYEGVRGNVNPVGFLIEGYTTLTASAFIGTTKQEVGTIGIAVAVPGGACGPIIGNFIGSYDYGIAYLNDMPGTQDSTDFLCLGNDFQNCIRNSLIINDVRTGTTLRRYLQHTSGLGYCFGGSIVQELRQSANNPTSMELGLGNVRQIEGNTAHKIDTITTAGVAGVAGAAGYFGPWFANSQYTTLDAAKFASLSGADRKMGPGEAAMVFVDAGGKMRLVEPYGAVVARTPAALSGTLSSTVGDTNLFSAAPTTGKFTVSVYGTVLTAGAGTTTLTLPLKWTDAKAARTENMVTAFDLVAGATYFRATLSVSVASGNITLGATFNTPSGTPGVVLDVTVTKDS